MKSIKAYKVTVDKFIVNDERDFIDDSFTEYVETLAQAAAIVDRIHENISDTNLVSITIETIHIKQARQAE